MDFNQVTVIVALLVSIFNLWDKVETRVKSAKEPTKVLENRLATVEASLVKKFEAYDGYFAKDLARFEKIEEGNRTVQRAILALLKHAIDGNDIEYLKDKTRDLEEYLIGK